MATAQKNSRSKRAKAAKPKKAAAPAPAVFEPQPLSNVLVLSRKSFQTLWLHKKFFAGIVAIYGLLNIIFVTGFNGGIDVSNVQGAVANRLAGTLSTYTSILTSSTGAPNEAAGVYQLFLVIFVGLALIWGFRQVYAGHKPRVRDAYYRGMYPIVPFLILVAVLGLQLLPMVIGTNGYQLVVAGGNANAGIEIIIWLLVALSLTVVSAYFAVATMVALLVVTLPDMSPRQALRLASKLVKGRRWTILRKMLFLPIVIIVVTALVLLPVIFVVPVAASILLLLLGPVMLAVGFSYIYALYRELVND